MQAGWFGSFGSARTHAMPPSRAAPTRFVSQDKKPEKQLEIHHSIRALGHSGHGGY